MQYVISFLEGIVTFISPCMPEYLLTEKIGSFKGMTLTRRLRMY